MDCIYARIYLPLEVARWARVVRNVSPRQDSEPMITPINHDIWDVRIELRTCSKLKNPYVGVKFMDELVGKLNSQEELRD
jgi:hypothetical protein